MAHGMFESLSFVLRLRSVGLHEDLGSNLGSNTVNTPPSTRPWRNTFLEGTNYKFSWWGEVNLQFPTRDKLSCSSTHHHGKEESQRRFKGQIRKIKYGIPSVLPTLNGWLLFKRLLLESSISLKRKKVPLGKIADFRGIKNGKSVGPDVIPVEGKTCLGEYEVQVLKKLLNWVMMREEIPRARR